ncbi:thiol:disulfide interchange protein DsbG [Salinisphaera aquimarina]|uniref:Thiol:disulfide interchange protein DsbG n=1 Tax=Salinisphaera aquimarina TaxID=2094031 RepID=A0ABV7EKY0_9GAMM
MPKNILASCWATIAGAGLLAATIAVHAAPTDKPGNAELPPVLQQAIDGGTLTVNKQFETDVPGVTGYVIERGGRHQIVYGEAGYLFMGQLVSPDGKNLSADYADKYMPKPDLAKVVEQLKDTGQLIQQGPDDAPLMYVFADPNCTYCHRFYEQADALVKAGKLQLQWAMVGFVKASSTGRAAAILSADDPLAALIENEAGFDEETENGGIAPVESPAGEIKTVLDSHAKQMAAAGGTGTPMLLYQQDGKWVSRTGAPGTPWLQTYVESQE